MILDVIGNWYSHHEAFCHFSEFSVVVLVAVSSFFRWGLDWTIKVFKKQKLEINASIATFHDNGLMTGYFMEFEIINMDKNPILLKRIDVVFKSNRSNFELEMNHLLLKHLEIARPSTISFNHLDRIDNVWVYTNSKKFVMNKKNIKRLNNQLDKKTKK